MKDGILRGVMRALRALLYAYLSGVFAKWGIAFPLPEAAAGTVNVEALAPAITTALAMGADKMIRDWWGSLKEKLKR